MSYVLATTHSKVQWYKFNFNSSIKEGGFVLLNELDLHEVPCFGDKETAKLAAKALGLKTISLYTTPTPLSYATDLIA